MILVTGGTGLVGSHLLYTLLNNGKDVRAIYRDSSSLKRLKKVFNYYTDQLNAEKLYNQIDWHKTSINDIPNLTRAFTGITQVYHCAAMIDFNPKNFDVLKKTNIEGTANVVNLCISKNVEKLCHVSSIATLGKNVTTQLINEDNYFNPEDDNSVYGISKYGAEMEVWRGTQEGLNAVIVNPGVIFGAGFWNSGSGVIMNIGSRGIPVYTSGTMGVVDVLDVVNAMQLLMDGTIKNERFVLVGENVSYKTLLTKMAAYFNHKPPRKYIAKWKLVIVSKIDWFFHTFFRTKRKLPRATIRSLYSSNNYDGSKIEQLNGFTYTSLDETLARIIPSYKSES